MNKQEKFMTLYEPVRENIWKFCLALTHDREDAKDLLSETVLAAYESLDSIRDGKAFLGYLFTVASRTFRRQRARQSRHNLTEPLQMDNIFGSHASPEDAADVRLLYETLDKLPVEQKEAIILYEIFGFSRKEIAGIQQTTVLNVKMRLYRGRNQLSKLMNSGNGAKTIIKEDTGNNIDSLHFSPASLKGAGHE